MYVISSFFVAFASGYTWGCGRGGGYAGWETARLYAEWGPGGSSTYMYMYMYVIWHSHELRCQVMSNWVMRQLVCNSQRIFSNCSFWWQMENLIIDGALVIVPRVHALHMHPHTIFLGASFFHSCYTYTLVTFILYISLYTPSLFFHTLVDSSYCKVLVSTK